MPSQNHCIHQHGTRRIECQQHMRKANRKKVYIVCWNLDAYQSSLYENLEITRPVANPFKLSITLSVANPFKLSITEKSNLTPLSVFLRRQFKHLPYSIFLIIYYFIKITKINAYFKNNMNNTMLSNELTISLLSSTQKLSCRQMNCDPSFYANSYASKWWELLSPNELAIEDLSSNELTIWYPIF